MDPRQADGMTIAGGFIATFIIVFAIFVIAEQVAITRNKKRGDR